MRVLVKLESAKSQPYEMEYHYHLQGFIYNLLKESKFSKIHDKEGYKFFCFSNVFPVDYQDEKEVRHMLISSPNPSFIKHITSCLQDRRNMQETIAIGSMQFLVKDAEIVYISPKLPCTLMSSTPILIRIPKEKYERFGVKTRYPYRYLFWRKEHPLEMFVEQLEDSLCKKYNELTGLEVPSEPIIQKLKFKKQVSTKIFIKDTQQTVIGTLWEFSFNDTKHEEIIKFAFDAGFGERSSLGFGFLNLKE